jgi:hypothetical protein
MFPTIPQRLAKRGGHSLGEQLPSAAELMATDPGVSSLQSAKASAEANLNFLMGQSHSYQCQKYKPRGSRTFQYRYCDISGRDLLNAKKKNDSKDCNYVTNRYTAYCQLSAQRKNIESAKKRIEDINKRLKDAEKRVWDRLSQSLPYKAYVIKPLVNRSSNSIVYQLTKDGKNVESPTETIDQAKALVDKGIASTQQKEVDTWTEKRKADIQVQEQAVQQATQQTSQPRVQTGPTVQTTTQQPLYKNPLVIGGVAALAALVFIK